ncbi:MAG: flagellar basal body-associated FliL family protein [Pseudomonadota bacterium]
MAKPDKAAPAETEVVAKPKSKKMLLIIIGVAVLGGGGGAAWYFTKGSSHKAEEAKVVAPQAPPKFIAMEPFTVNLQSTEGDKFLQIGITLKIVEPELEEKLKLHLPEIRSRVLLLLSSKRASDLTSSEDKNYLAAEIVADVNRLLGLPVAPLPKREKKRTDTSGIGDDGMDEAEPASGVASAVAAAPEAEAAQPESAVAGAEKGHAIDVLFTSFIIQ